MRNSRLFQKRYFSMGKVRFLTMDCYFRAQYFQENLPWTHRGSTGGGYLHPRGVFKIVENEQIAIYHYGPGPRLSVKLLGRA